MRSTLSLTAALTLLVLTGCDSAGGDTAFVGSWTLADASAVTVVQSRTEQSLLVLSQPSGGAVAITGDQIHTLGAVTYSAEPSVGQILALRPASEAPYNFQTASLLLSRSVNDQGQARSAASFRGLMADGSRVRTYRTELDAAPFVRDGDRLAVPTVTMTDEDGRRVTASGALTFPTVQAPAGQEVGVPARADALPTQGSITFGTNGRVTWVSESESIRDERGGTWTEIAPGRVSLDFGGTPLEFDIEVSGGRLRMTESSAVAETCATATDCLAFVEDEVFAERGTLASAQRLKIYTYR